MPTYLFDGRIWHPQGTILVYDVQGRICDITRSHVGISEIQRREGLLCPGFVNAHCHVELSHLRGRIPRQTGLPDFLRAVITQRHAHSPAEEAYIQERIADTLQYMWQTGTRSLADIVNTTLTLPAKQICSDLYIHNLIEQIGFDNPLCAEKVALFEGIAEAFARAALPHSYAFHAPYSVTEAWMQHRPPAGIVSIHNQECAAENALYEEGRGAFMELYAEMGIAHGHFRPPKTTSFVYYFPRLVPQAHRVLFVHNTCMRPSDIAYYRSQEVAWQEKSFFVLCARANAYITGATPSTTLLDDVGDQICIGTDSLASNTDVSMLQEILFLQKTYRVSVERLLYWATYNGARALDIVDRFGHFDAGKQPGILLIQGVDPEGFTEEVTLENIA